MKMKKVLSLVLAATLTLSLAACGGKDNGQETQGESNETAADSSQDEEPAAADEADNAQESAGGVIRACP